MRILLVDDNPDDRVMVKMVLNESLRSVEYLEALDRDEFEDILTSGEFDLVITDYQLKWASGLDVVKRVKELYPEKPVLMFTGTGSEEVAVEAMKSGLDDYILKSPKHFKRLPAAVKGVLQKTALAIKAKEAEHRYKDLFDRLPVCVYRSTIDGRIVEMNPSGLKIFGCLNFDDIKEYNLKSLYVHPEKRDHLVAELNRKGFVTDFKTEMKRIDGSTFHAEIHATLKRDINGNPRYVDGILDDITDHVEAEKEKTRLYNILSTLFEHLPVGVFFIDSDHTLAHATPLAAEYLAYLEGLKPGDTITALQGKPIEEYIISPPGIIWNEVSRKSGAMERIFEIGGRRVTADGRVLGIVFIIRDVTEERKTEEKLLAQERLAAVGQLAAGIAHDFNNILTGIIGYAEMLMSEEGLPYYVKKRIDIILQSGIRAANMVKQILDFSRKSVSEEAVFDLVSFMREFVRFAARVVPETIKIEFSTQLDRCKVCADPAKMQQVFTNLVVNAKDAMPEGGKIHITVRKEYLEHPPLPDMSPGRWVVIDFTDTGSGIPHECLPHIFEPFYTTKPVGHGTGLGLSQVYGIITQHGGFIDVRSEVGKGTVFTIYLPETDAEVSTKPAKHHPYPMGQGEILLIVEDNEEVRNFLTTLLGELQYRTVSVTNGVEALDVFRQKSDEIALILTDLVMPEMGGMEFCNRVREIRPDVKVIAVSGYPLMPDDQRHMLQCFDRIVTKPFEIKDIAVVIRELLQS